MADLDDCFVAAVAARGVTIVDVAVDASGGATSQSQTFTALEPLDDFLHGPAAGQYVSRYISICQDNSWSALQVTRPMLDLIVSEHGIGASFYDLPSCFYSRDSELEEAYCVPYSHTRTGEWTEISYSLRYPELKKEGPGKGKWVLRQSAVFHRLNATSRQNLFVFFSPNARSAVDLAAQVALQNDPADVLGDGAFWLHERLFSAHAPSWRRYIASLELEVLPIADTTLASYIEGPLSVGYDHLSKLVGMERQLSLTTTLLDHAADVLDALAALPDAHPEPDALRLRPLLRNYHRKCGGDTRNAGYLRDRARATAQLLADTLALRDQVIAKEQNASMLQLNKSAVFITTLTLVYLPASFAATFFGMNFFDLDMTNNRIVGSPMVWVFFVVSLGLTSVTFGFYYWLVHEQDSAIFRRLVPKARITADWRPAMPKWNLNKPRCHHAEGASAAGGRLPPGIELQGLSV